MAAEKPDDDRYLIWSNEHRAWWGRGARGYVRGAWDAGIYTRAQALEYCRSAIPGSGPTFNELPVRLADMKEFIADQLVPASLL